MADFSALDNLFKDPSEVPASPSLGQQTAPGLPVARASTPADDAFAKLDSLFNGAPADQLDPDSLGLATAKAGQASGNGWTSDTVTALNIYGQKVSYDVLMQMDGGRQLIDMARANRSGPRGFVDALTTGSGWDFVPYANDLASTR